MVHPTESCCGLKQGSNYVAITVLTLGSFPGLNTASSLAVDKLHTFVPVSINQPVKKIFSDLSDRATARATN